ncbi:hypothetical protein MO973_35315 [Paenibacillus sp. TRM 82003]|uniref:hypothetical protein n=1 Tax=Kineococcus sp. TRM81007 TaxID=2925831 RepID=UPI001F592AFB|nr:hypothetical protein [Kineococcus sp. TRM81007]MCI2240590.1 hypothetical protein [Kineococcus sp. TRM81007]MCI3925488.1 hypothetical protein [Paenibacillus sp. TRM 82003]
MTPIVIAASLLLAGPSVAAALTGTGSVDTALLHLLLALLVCTVAARAVRALVLHYQGAVEAAAEAQLEADGDAGADHPARRRGDA